MEHFQRVAHGHFHRPASRTRIWRRDRTSPLSRRGIRDERQTALGTQLASSMSPTFLVDATAERRPANAARRTQAHAAGGDQAPCPDVDRLCRLLVVAKRAAPGSPILGAFAEAGIVSACADWFAIVALFRHPAGSADPAHRDHSPQQATARHRARRFYGAEFFAPVEILTERLDGDRCRRLDHEFTKAA